MKIVAIVVKSHWAEFSPGETPAPRRCNFGNACTIAYFTSHKRMCIHVSVGPQKGLLLLLHFVGQEALELTGLWLQIML